MTGYGFTMLIISALLFMGSLTTMDVPVPEKYARISGVALWGTLALTILTEIRDLVVIGAIIGAAFVIAFTVIRYKLEPGWIGGWLVTVIDIAHKALVAYGAWHRDYKFVLYTTIVVYALSMVLGVVAGTVSLKLKERKHG